MFQGLTKSDLLDRWSAECYLDYAEGKKILSRDRMTMVAKRCCDPHILTVHSPGGKEKMVKRMTEFLAHQILGGGLSSN